MDVSCILVIISNIFESKFFLPFSRNIVLPDIFQNLQKVGFFHKFYIVHKLISFELYCSFSNKTVRSCYWKVMETKLIVEGESAVALH